MEWVIQADQLEKSYGHHKVVDNISFSVRQGEIFGIAGPNGAGKTTTLNLMTGLLKPDKGTLSILGLNPQSQGSVLRRRLGIQLQQAELPENMRVQEALDLFSSLYERPANAAKLLDEWGLTSKAKREFRKLSGGERQRLFIALALINDPEIVFLDELTTGLDPKARRQTWDLVRQIRDRGKTVVQVTHFMDEAEQLCDRVGIIHQGKLVALDSPRALIQSQPNSHAIRFQHSANLNLEAFSAIAEVNQVVREGDEVVIYGQGSLLLRVAAELAKQNIDPEGFRSEHANLEDVFLHLTQSDKA